MTTLDFNVLTTALTTILRAIEHGNSNIEHAFDLVTTTLGVIEIILFGAWVMLGHESLGAGVRKFLGIQIWLWIIRGFHELAKSFMKTLVAGGFRVGGQSGDMGVLLDPSAIAARALTATQPIADQVENLSRLEVATKLLMGGLMILLVFAFILMAVNVAWAVIEFYLYLNLSALLMPFALFQHTRFLADKAINAVLACALKLAVLAFVLALIQPILAEVKLNQGPTKLGISWNDMFAMILVVCFCAGLVIKTPALAAGLIHGSPTLSGTAAVMWAAGWAASGAQAVGAGALGLAGEALRGVGQGFADGYSLFANAGANSRAQRGSESMAAAASPAAIAGGGRGGVLVGVAYYPASAMLQAPSAPAFADNNYVDAEVDGGAREPRRFGSST